MEVIQYMNKVQAEVACIQEAMINTNSVFMIEDYIIITTTNCKNAGNKQTTTTYKDRTQAQAKTNPKAKGKAKTNAKANPKVKAKAKASTGNARGNQENIEHWGVAIIIHKELGDFRQYYKQIDGRNIESAFNGRNGDKLVIPNHYAPHNGRPLAEREAFFKQISNSLWEHRHGWHIMVGDFNSRLHARREGEEHIIGPHTFGRGREFLETHYINETTNRDLLMETLQCNEATIANSFSQTDPSKR